MNTPASKILTKLNAHNEGAQARRIEAAKAEFLAPYKAKAQAMQDAGPIAECAEITKHIRAIYELVKRMDPRIKFTDAEFYDNQQVGELNEGDYYCAGSYGWRPAQLELPHRIVMNWKTQETQVSKWRSVPNGKRTLYVGGYGRSDSAGTFQTLKDGSMKYYDIAQTISRCIMGADARAQQEAAKAQNSSSVARVISESGLQLYRGIALTSTDVSEKPVMVRIERSVALSEEDALALIAVLKGYGIG